MEEKLACQSVANVSYTATYNEIWVKAVTEENLGIPILAVRISFL